jgi:peptidoglycan/xylan/chitin deacetylase (PgdA/CDA1 family)
LRRTNHPLALNYHGVERVSLRDDPSNLFVKPQDLRKHIRKLRAWGYRFVRFGEFAAGVVDGRGENLAAVTFDDGLVDNVTTLLPLLRVENVPATIFLVPGWFGRPHPDAPWTRIVTPDEARELAAAGVEIGAHSMTHRDLSTLSYDEARLELLESRELLEETLQASVTVAAYPYGHASPETRRACRDAGFEFACRAGGLGDWTDPYGIPRQSMGNGSTVLSLRLKRNPRYHDLMDSGPMTAARTGYRKWRKLRDQGRLS